MKNKLIGIIGGLVLCFLLIGLAVAQDLWDIKKSRNPAIKYSNGDLFMVTENVGWIITEDQIFKTTNGCLSFTEQTNPTTKVLAGLYFLDENTGLIFGDSALCLRTSDGGTNWNVISLPVPESLNTYSCYFLNNTLGWLSLNKSSYHSCVIKTTDAGLTWTYFGMIDATKTGANGIGYTGTAYPVFWDENNGAVGCGTGVTSIYGYYSTDGGATWTAGTITAGSLELYRPSTRGFGNAVVRTGANDARMFNLRGAMLKTTNRGVNWVSDDTWWNPYSTPVAIWDVWQIDDTYGFYCMKGTLGTGLNQIGRTTNSWNSYDATQYVYTGTGANAQLISFVDQNIGYALMQDNFLIKTTDGGSTWAPVDPNAWPDWDFDRIWNYGSGHFMAISDYSTPCHSTDYGETWSVPTAQTPPAFTGDINDLDYRNGVTIGVSGYSAALRSTDDGYNWTKVTLPPTATTFYSVAFADANVVVTGASSGKMCRSTDAGLTWSNLTTIARAGTIYKILFKDANNGYLTGSKGVAYYTTNAGATWSYRDSIYSASYYDMAFADANLGYMVGYRGYLGKTIDGGTNWDLVDSLGYDSGTSTYGPTCYSILFKDALEGWIGADKGVVYHTIDAGLTWNAEPAITTPVGDNPTIRDLNYSTAPWKTVGYDWRLSGCGGYGFLGKYCDGAGTPPYVTLQYPDTLTLLMPVNVNVGGTLSFWVTANDNDTPSDLLYMTMTGVGNLVYTPDFSPATGTYSWTLVAGDTALAPYTVNFTAMDGCLSGYIDQIIDIDVFVHGDANYDFKISVSDVVYLINYLFKGGPAPQVMMAGDANGDTPETCIPKVSVSDVVYLINYLFKGGPFPVINTSCLPLIM
jgi:photosystem II stability/assembly factor-like uncharacterized protein